jgi:hypothetical protein
MVTNGSVAVQSLRTKPSKVGYDSVDDNDSDESAGPTDEAEEESASEGVATVSKGWTGEMKQALERGAFI